MANRRGKKRYKGRRRSKFSKNVVEIRRVTRVVAGGKRMRFRALVVMGDRKGQVGIGVRKGSDVADAISKASDEARKTMTKINLKEGTIPHGVKMKYKGAQIILKPAPEGSGVIAGGPIRAVVDLVGIKNVSSKILGSANKVANVKAAFEALKSLQKVDEGQEEEDENKSKNKSDKEKAANKTSKKDNG